MLNELHDVTADGNQSDELHEPLEHSYQTKVHPLWRSKQRIYLHLANFRRTILKKTKMTKIKTRSESPCEDWLKPTQREGLARRRHSGDVYGEALLPQQRILQAALHFTPLVKAALLKPSQSEINGGREREKNTK